MNKHEHAELAEQERDEALERLAAAEKEIAALTARGGDPVPDNELLVIADLADAALDWLTGQAEPHYSRDEAISELTDAVKALQARAGARGESMRAPEVLDKPICEIESYLGLKLGATYRIVADPECVTCVDHAKLWEKA